MSDYPKRVDELLFFAQQQLQAVERAAQEQATNPAARLAFVHAVLMQMGQALQIYLQEITEGEAARYAMVEVLEGDLPLRPDFRLKELQALARGSTWLCDLLKAQRDMQHTAAAKKIAPNVIASTAQTPDNTWQWREMTLSQLQRIAFELRTLIQRHRDLALEC